MEDHMTLVIIIDGPSADALMAVGPIDLRDHFLANHLGIDPKDVARITFKQELGETPLIGPATVHSDNFIRGESE